MNIETTKKTPEAEIRDLVDDWVKGLHEKDIKRVMSHYAADIVSFDLAPPLQYTGAVALKKSFEEWFPSFLGPVNYEIRDLNITASDDIGFCRSINRISGTRSDGEKTDVWVRATVCCRKIDSKWMVTHEHVSVPFYMDGSYRAAVDLKP
jgi:ketosteroid isomerase-like protein